MSDIETFLTNNHDRVYAVYSKKHIFTPYEQEKKFTDQQIWVHEGEYYLTNGIE